MTGRALVGAFSGTALAHEARPCRQRLDRLERAEAGERAARALEQPDLVELVDQGHTGGAPQRPGACAEDVGGRGGRGLHQAPAAGEAHLAAQRVDAERGHAPAAAHEAPQPLLHATGQPARVARQQHAAVLLQARALVAGQGDVGRHVEASLRARQPGQQRRLALGEPGGQPAARVDAVQAHPDAAVEQVRRAVAVVVDGIAALPRHDGQHDQHVAGALALDRERHRRAPVGGGHVEQEDARGRARRTHAQRTAARARAAPRRARGADTADAPLEALAARVDAEGRRLAGPRRRGRRRGAEVADGDAALAREALAVAGSGHAGVVQRGRAADVAGDVARLDTDDVRARRSGTAVVQAPVPAGLRRAVGDPQPLDDGARPPGRELVDRHLQAAARRVQADRRLATARHRQQLRPRDRAPDRSDGEHARARRARVEAHGAREDQAAPLLLQRDAIAVDAVGARARRRRRGRPTWRGPRGRPGSRWRAARAPRRRHGRRRRWSRCRPA